LPPSAALLPCPIVPVSIVVSPGTRPIVLSQDLEAIAKLEAPGDLESALAKQAPFDYGGYKVLFRGVTPYQSKRLLYDCLVLKLNGAPTAEKPKV